MIGVTPSPLILLNKATFCQFTIDKNSNVLGHIWGIENKVNAPTLYGSTKPRPDTTGHGAEKTSKSVYKIKIKIERKLYAFFYVPVPSYF